MCIYTECPETSVYVTANEEIWTCATFQFHQVRLVFLLGFYFFILEHRMDSEVYVVCFLFPFM
jgi:hypothetical protein